jgi:hypothetical protein
MQEVILAKELEHGLYPADGLDLSAELEEARACVDRINDERAAEAEELSHRVMRISNVLVDLGLLPVQDIPQLPKSAREVFPAVDLVFHFLLYFAPRNGWKTHFNIYIYVFTTVMENLCRYSPELPCLQMQ